jgi:hypothetical protein
MTKSTSDLSADRVPDTIATPEGDGEFASGEPLAPVDGLEIPPGNAPAAYEADKPSEMSEMIEVLDEISRGRLLP